MPVGKKLGQAVSIIVTTFNESETILQLLQALEQQTLQPAEIVVVDANSSDGTAVVVTNYIKKTDLSIKLYSKTGNRSIGRNLAIKKAKSPLIAITDAGCVPEKNWLKELVSKQIETSAPVVAGYYQGLAQTAFEEAVIPYVLVLPDRVDEKTFLPATRSMLLTKKVWQQLGGFDASLSDNEDYVFARKLQQKNILISFAKNAIVSWRPRSNLTDFFGMIFRFARGDATAGLFRPKVAFLFVRYALLLIASLIILVFLPPKFLLKLWVPLGVLYSIWAVDKNVRYTPKGWKWLPLLQYTADAAVLSGTLVGLFIRLRKTIFG